MYFLLVVLFEEVYAITKSCISGIHADTATLTEDLRGKNAVVQYFPVDRQSFDRDKAAAAAYHSYSVLPCIERTVLTRQSFVSSSQRPDPKQDL